MPRTRIHGDNQILDGTISDGRIAAAAGIQTTKLADGTRLPFKDAANIFTAVQDFGGLRVTNVAAPTGNLDVANKSYVDAAISGLDIKESVRAATVASIANLGAGPLTIDGITLAQGNRVLVKDGASTNGVAAVSDANNGIYIVGVVGGTNSGVWTRALDSDTAAEITPGMFMFAEEGTSNHDTGWVLITDGVITLGTTLLSFTQFSGATSINAGAGLTFDPVARTLDVNSANAGIVVNADNVALTLSATDPGLTITASGLATTSDVSRVSKFIQEVGTGIADGVNTLFTASVAPISNTLMVFVNGLLQRTVSYTLAGVNVTFAADSVPPSGAEVRFGFQKA